MLIAGFFVWCPNGVSSLININEFDKIKENSRGFLKDFIQKSVIKNIRKPHRTSVEWHLLLRVECLSDTMNGR